MGKNITVIPANRIRNDNMKQWYDGYSFKREKHIEGHISMLKKADIKPHGISVKFRIIP